MVKKPKRQVDTSSELTWLGFSKINRPNVTVDDDDWRSWQQLTR